MNISNRNHQQVFFIIPQYLSWRIWFTTACLLLAGIFVGPLFFLLAIGLSILQTAYFIRQKESLLHFSVQIRISYTVLLLICFTPGLRWLFWWPMIGTFALNIYGYCFLGRCLSLLPCNRKEVFSAELVSRTFLSRPILPANANSTNDSDCAAGLCSIEAQVRSNKKEISIV